MFIKLGSVKTSQVLACEPSPTLNIFINMTIKPIKWAAAASWVLLLSDDAVISPRFREAERAPSDLRFKLTTQVLSHSHTRRDGKPAAKKQRLKTKRKSNERKKNQSGDKNLPWASSSERPCQVVRAGVSPEWFLPSRTGSGCDCTLINNTVMCA